MSYLRYAIVCTKNGYDARVCIPRSSIIDRLLGFYMQYMYAEPYPECALGCMLSELDNCPEEEFLGNEEKSIRGAFSNAHAAIMKCAHPLQKKWFFVDLVALMSLGAALRYARKDASQKDITADFFDDLLGICEGVLLDKESPPRVKLAESRTMQEASNESTAQLACKTTPRWATVLWSQQLRAHTNSMNEYIYGMQYDPDGQRELYKLEPWALPYYEPFDRCAVCGK